MIKCRCGTWTNFGMTCAKCASDVWNTPSSHTESTDEKEDDVELVSLDELEELEEDED